MITLSPVKSGAFKALGHSGETLAVQYTSGKVWHFPGVPAEQYHEALQSKSVGSSIIKLTQSRVGSQFIEE